MKKLAHARKNAESEYLMAEAATSRIIHLCMKNVNTLLTIFEGIVLGYYLKGYSCREIAGLTERSPKSVDNAVQRIRKKLARHIVSLGDFS